MSEPGLIQRKLRVPPLAASVVVRPRLERLLASLVDSHAVTVVSATAGAGKTTAVVRATELLDRPVAWLAVDRTDRAPGRLVAYLEAALARVVPEAAGVARDALAAGLSHAEAAGLLAEAAGDAPVVLVLDDLERIDDPEAWAVIEPVVRYAPAAMRIVLVSRREIPLTALPAGAAAALGDTDLAFTADEAAEALAALGARDVDAGAAVKATGGWVTGVLFEVWRSDSHTAGTGGEADPLRGYLAAHIVGRLAPEDIDFLERTSLLDEVNAHNAERMGVEHAGERLAAIRAVHLPVAWLADGTAMRCHPRFREYLQARLERRSSADVRALHRARGHLLSDRGLDEDATEELLVAGEPAEALATAERAIVGVIERLDLSVAERWLEALQGVERDPTSPLVTAELMLAVGREDYRRGLQIADDLAARGRRDELARSSPRVAALMAWCYLHVGRFDEVRALLDVAGDDPSADAVRYAMQPLADRPGDAPPPRPVPTGSAVDALLLRASYHLGRLSDLAEAPSSRWVEAVTGPWRIGALRATGRTQRALELYEEAQAAGVATVGLHAAVGPEVLIDAGRAADAHDAVARGREIARRAGSLIFELFNGVAEAKLALRLERDPAAAREIVERLETELDARRYPHVREQLDTWYGLALLQQGEDGPALARLRRAVEDMLPRGLILELPTAAVYLSEAEWRAGNEERADRAADLALEGARRQGSNHLLLQALADFPAVAARRIDAEPGADSPWHDLGRALIAQGHAIETLRMLPAVELREFGTPALLVEGAEVRPRIAKSYELLAYLAQRPGGAEREELLGVLFAGRADESARAYLRQALHQLRQILPEDGISSEHGHIELGGGLRLTTESQRLEDRLAEAARMRGEERLAATVAALEPVERGEWLPGVDSAWADERRRALDELAAGARYEAAELAYSAGRFDDAQRWAQAVLREEPYREAAWRLTMRIANALGDDDGVIVAYQGCEAALGELGIGPAHSTRQLLERLRR